MKTFVWLSLFSLVVALSGCGPTGEGGGSGGSTSDRQLQFCGGISVDVSSSASHCGECNNSCDGGTCSAGRCQGGSTGTNPPSGGSLADVIADYLSLAFGGVEVWIYKDLECPCFAEEFGISEAECLAEVAVEEQYINAMRTCIRDALSQSSAPTAAATTTCLQTFVNSTHTCRDHLSTCHEDAEWEFEECVDIAWWQIDGCLDSVSPQEIDAVEDWIEANEDALDECF